MATFTHTEYHDNEAIAATGQLTQDGQKHGTWFFYTDNRLLEVIGHYQYGQKHGKWTTYSHSTHVAPRRVSVDRYAHGKCVASESFSEDPSLDSDLEDSAPRIGVLDDEIARRWADNVSRRFSAELEQQIPELLSGPTAPQSSAPTPPQSSTTKTTVLDDETARRVLAQIEQQSVESPPTVPQYEYWTSHYDGRSPNRCGSLEGALEYINCFTERTQMAMVLWRKNIPKNRTELYMVYPFPQLLSRWQLSEQLLKVKELYEGDLPTREEFYAQLNHLRTRCFSNQLHNKS